MSKARLIITAVIVEGRSQAEVARDYGVSEGWVSKLIARYKAEGEAAFETRSRCPLTSLNRLSSEVVDLIVDLRNTLAGDGLDAGPETISWHLESHYQIPVSAATVWRYLKTAGLVEPQPAKRPKSSYVRFEAAMPNEMWQADFTHWPLGDGTDTEILSFLDDRSRFVISVTAHPRVNGVDVVTAFRAAVNVYGPPASTLTDNGMVFTARYATGKGGRNGFENELAHLGITQKNSRPNHPTRQSRTIPTNTKTMAPSPTTSRHHQPATTTTRHLRHHLQPPAATPSPRPKNPRHHLQPATQSHPDHQTQHPLPDPIRHRR